MTTSEDLKKEELIEEYNQKIYNGEVSVCDGLNNLFKAGQLASIKDEIEYFKWVLDAVGKGYTKEFYETNLLAHLKKLTQKVTEMKG